ncbi:hypothetical protein [Streptomyces sp. NPDC058108]|uniref:hypothetical protein n=1 Tax=Streptomyces sp. NPDC058108 TaxID=3346344 RepID=UPI0036F0B214
MVGVVAEDLGAASHLDGDGPHRRVVGITAETPGEALGGDRTERGIGLFAEGVGDVVQDAWLSADLLPRDTGDHARREPRVPRRRLDDVLVRRDPVGALLGVGGRSPVTVFRPWEVGDLEADVAQCRGDDVVPGDGVVVLLGSAAGQTGQRIRPRLGRLAPQVRDGRDDVDALNEAHAEVRQQVVRLLELVDADLPGLVFRDLRQMEITAGGVVQPVRVVADVVDVHGELGEEVHDAGGGPHVLPLAHRLRLLGLTGDRRALGVDQVREGPFVRPAVGVVRLGDRQGRRVIAQGGGCLVVTLGELCEQLARLREPGFVVPAALALPPGVLLGPLGGRVDRHEHVVQALELVRVPLDEGRVAALQIFNVLAVADPAAHRASGATYWP